MNRGTAGAQFAAGFSLKVGREAGPPSKLNSVCNSGGSAASIPKAGDFTATCSGGAPLGLTPEADPYIMTMSGSD